MCSVVKHLVNIAFLIIAAMGFFCSHAFAQEITKPYTFSPNTPAKSSEVNENFDVLYDAVNSLRTGWMEAEETWSFMDSNDPSFSFIVPGNKLSKYNAGMKVKLTQNRTKYFIITQVSYSNPDTIITVYGGTDYDLENSQISKPSYSLVKSPAGFPMEPTKWTIKVTDMTDRNYTGSSAWVNLGDISIDIPTGAWEVSYSVQAVVENVKGGANIRTTLSTARDDETDQELTAFSWLDSPNDGNHRKGNIFSKEKDLILTSPKTYYLNGKGGGDGSIDLMFRNSQNMLVIKAKCSYL